MLAEQPLEMTTVHPEPFGKSIDPNGLMPIIQMPDRQLDLGGRPGILTQTSHQPGIEETGPHRIIRRGPNRVLQHPPFRSPDILESDGTIEQILERYPAEMPHSTGANSNREQTAKPVSFETKGVGSDADQTGTTSPWKHEFGPRAWQHSRKPVPQSGHVPTPVTIDIRTQGLAGKDEMP